MIKLIVLDVDGCLSDGGVIYSSNSSESKTFNIKDGLGISTWIRLGHEVAIITGRESSIVKRRSEELGIQHLYQGVKDKESVFRKLVDSLGLKFYEVGVIGDDLNDYKMLSMAGRSFTPNDGVDEIKKIVDTVLAKKGGDGAVREMIEILVDECDLREKFLAVWI